MVRQIKTAWNSITYKVRGEVIYEVDMMRTLTGIFLLFLALPLKLNGETTISTITSKQNKTPMSDRTLISNVTKVASQTKKGPVTVQEMKETMTTPKTVQNNSDRPVNSVMTPTPPMTRGSTGLQSTAPKMDQILLATTESSTTVIATTGQTTESSTTPIATTGKTTVPGTTRATTGMAAGHVTTTRATNSMTTGHDTTSTATNSMTTGHDTTSTTTTGKATENGSTTIAITGKATQPGATSKATTDKATSMTTATREVTTKLKHHSTNPTAPDTTQITQSTLKPMIQKPPKKDNQAGAIAASLIGFILLIMFIVIGLILVKKKQMKKKQLETPDWAGPTPFIEGDIQPNLPVLDDHETYRHELKRISLHSFLPQQFFKRVSLLKESDEVQLEDIPSGITFGQKTQVVHPPNGTPQGDHVQTKTNNQIISPAVQASSESTVTITEEPPEAPANDLTVKPKEATPDDKTKSPAETDIPSPAFEDVDLNLSLEGNTDNTAQNAPEIPSPPSIQD